MGACHPFPNHHNNLTVKIVLHTYIISLLRQLLIKLHYLASPISYALAEVVSIIQFGISFQSIWTVIIVTEIIKLYDTLYFFGKLWRSFKIDSIIVLCHHIYCLWECWRISVPRSAVNLTINMKNFRALITMLFPF